MPAEASLLSSSVAICQYIGKLERTVQCLSACFVILGVVIKAIIIFSNLSGHFKVASICLHCFYASEQALVG